MLLKIIFRIRLQEATVEEGKLRKQVENSEYELQLQKKELTNTHAQEKLTLVKVCCLKYHSMKFHSILS